MAEQPRPDDLAQLHATVTTLQTRLARVERRKRLPRRFMPLALVGLLVALLPLSILAAGPVFSDLSTAAPEHQPNIQAIGNAGITTGFADPNNPGQRLYDPKANVTREEMASFLARTAGLGGNPPVANAQTAQTANNATNATNAQNAATLGGYPADALNRVAFAATKKGPDLPNTAVATDIIQVTLTVPGTVPQAVVVRGVFNPYGQPSGGYINAAIRQDSETPVGFLDFPYVTLASNPIVGAVMYCEWVFVAAPGSHTYALVATATGTGGPLTTSRPRLTATTHPFGATGTAGATDIETAPLPGDKP